MPKKEDLISSENSGEITKAREHQNYISFFIETYTSLSDAPSKKYMRWIGSWLNKDNVIKFRHFLRFPLETADIIQSDVEPELARMFLSSNKVINYKLADKDVTNDAFDYLVDIEQDDFFRYAVWHECIRRHNSLIITDIDEVNQPYNFILTIDELEQIEFIGREISAILFSRKEEVELNGITYDEIVYHYTNETYDVYLKLENSEELVLLSSNPHDLGRTPAQFIAKETLNSNSLVIRKSIYSNLLTDFEEFTTMSVMYRYYLKHGGLPFTTIYKQNNAKSCGTNFSTTSKCENGYIAVKEATEKDESFRITEQRCPNCHQDEAIQANSKIEFGVPKEKDGKFFDINQNFVKFPAGDIDITEWFKVYLKEKEDLIVSKLVGETKQDDGQAKNELHINKIVSSKENTLSYLSAKMSKTRSVADQNILALRYGPTRLVVISYDYGTIFHLENETTIREQRKESSNPLDAYNIEKKLITNRFKNDSDSLQRELLLLELLPYNGLNDERFFEIASMIDPINKELRLNFSKYISKFEAIVMVPIDVYLNDFFEDEVVFKQRVQSILEQLNGLVEVPVIVIEEPPTE